MVRPNLKQRAVVLRQCNFCRVSVNIRSYKRHVAAHDLKTHHICPFCKKNFAQKSAMKTHCNIHTGRRPHVCPECAGSFSDPASCSRHKRTVHSEKEPCPIERCDKGYKRRDALKQHLMKKHNIRKADIPYYISIVIANAQTNVSNSVQTVGPSLIHGSQSQPADLILPTPVTASILHAPTVTYPSDVGHWPTSIQTSTYGSTSVASNVSTPAPSTPYMQVEPPQVALPQYEQPYLGYNSLDFVSHSPYGVYSAQDTWGTGGLLMPVTMSYKHPLQF